MQHRRDLTVPRILARLAVAVAVAGLAASSLGSCSSGGGSGGSSSLPDATLTSLADGSSVSFADYRGTPLVVNLWAPWCAPCKREMPAFEQVHQDLGKQVAIVGVTDSLDEKGAKALADDTGVSYPLLVDADGTLQQDLGVAGLPATVFVDADGRIVGRHAGALTRQELADRIGALYGTT